MNWSDLKSLTIDELIDWAEPLPWCRAMAECGQDANWHAEGDVWTHTKRVMRELPTTEGWGELDSDRQRILIWTALLHDVAKPLMTETDPETGRVRSPKHAVRGEFVARSVLRELGCEREPREQIAKLVRYHGRPVFLLERENPAVEVAWLSWLLDNRLLSMFALADARGRDSDSAARPEENLHLWRLMAEETGCFDRPYPFPSDHARFLFYRRQPPNLYDDPHADFSCTVTLTSALPGAGKDRWIERNRPAEQIVSLDAIRAELGIGPTGDQGRVLQRASDLCKTHLRAGTDFVFNATNTTRMIRGRWLDLFAAYGARIVIAHLDPPLETVLDRNRSRTDPVPESVIRKLCDRMEPPNLTECHELVVSES